MNSIQINLDISDGFLILQIFSAIQSATKKHPEFVKTPEQVVSVLGEEFGEFAQAINDKKFDKARQEALDVIAVCCRFIKRTYPNSMEDLDVALNKLVKKVQKGSIWQIKKKE